MNGVAVGSINQYVAQGGQIKVNGLGFKPSYVFFWQGSDVESTWGGSGGTVYGFAGRDINGKIVQCRVGASGYAPGSLTSTTPARGFHLSGSPSLTHWTWYVSSFDTDGFTLDIGAGSVVSDLRFMAIYASSLTSYCKIHRWAANTSSGNQAVNAGLASAPAVVMHLTAGLTTDADRVTSSTGAELGFGMMQTFGSQAAMAMSHFSSGGVSTTNRRQSGSHAILCNNETADTVVAAGTMVSLDSNGFTVNWATAPTKAIQILSICIVGLTQTKIGVFNKSTGAAPVSQNVAHGLGLIPDGVLFAGTCQVTSGTVNPSWRAMFGASDGENDCSFVSTLQDNSATPANRNTVRLADAIIKANNDTYTQEALAYVTSFDGTNIVLQWHVNDAVADEFIYWAVYAALPNESGFGTDQTPGPGSNSFMTGASVLWRAASPTRPDYGNLGSPRGSLWWDTSTDPATLRIADGYRWRKVFTPYQELVGLAGGQSVTGRFLTLVPLAAWNIDDNTYFTGYKLLGKIENTGASGALEVYLRLNGDTNTNNLLPIGSVNSGAGDDFIVVIPSPAAYETTPVALPSTASAASFALGDLYTNVRKSLTLSDGLITSIEVLGYHLATSAANAGMRSSFWTLFKQNRDFYDYS